MVRGRAIAGRDDSLLVSYIVISSIYGKAATRVAEIAPSPLR